MRNQLEQVYELIQEDRYNDAIQLLKPILDANPKNADAWWLMANAVEDPVEARKALINVLKNDPSHQRAQETLETLNDQFPPNDEELRLLIELDDVLNKVPLEEFEEPMSDDELLALFEEDSDIDLSDFETEIGDFSELEDEDPLAALTDTLPEEDGKRGRRRREKQSRKERSESEGKRNLLRPVLFVLVAALIATALFVISGGNDESDSGETDTGQPDLAQLVAVDASDDSTTTSLGTIQQSVSSVVGTDNIVFLSEGTDARSVLFVQSCVCVRRDCTAGPPSSELTRVVDQTFLTVASQLQDPALDNIAALGVNIVNCTAQSDVIYRATVSRENALAFLDNGDMNTFRNSWSVIEN